MEPLNITDRVINNINRMSCYDKFRDGQVVVLSNIFTRCLQFFIDLIHGGRKKLDVQAFDAISPLLIQRVDTLFARLSQPIDLAIHRMEIFSQVKDLLRLEAKMKVTGWASNLTSSNHAVFQLFSQKIQALHVLAKQRVDLQLRQDAPLQSDSYQLRRWIVSNSFQRDFAASTNSGQLPYRAEEIPRGALLLCDLHSYLVGIQLKGHRFSVIQLISRIKEVFMRLLIRHTMTHAEISLGSGLAYHQYKGDSFFSGVGCLEDRRPRLVNGQLKHKIYYAYDIVVPDKERIEEALRAANNPIQNYDQWIDAVERDLRARQSEIKTSFIDVLKMAYDWGRPRNYDSSRVLYCH